MCGNLRGLSEQLHKVLCHQRFDASLGSEENLFAILIKWFIIDRYRWLFSCHRCIMCIDYLRWQHCCGQRRIVAIVIQYLCQLILVTLALAEYEESILNGLCAEFDHDIGGRVLGQQNSIAHEADLGV